MSYFICRLIHYWACYLQACTLTFIQEKFTRDWNELFTFGTYINYPYQNNNGPHQCLIFVNIRLLSTRFIQRQNLAEERTYNLKRQVSEQHQNCHLSGMRTANEMFREILVTAHSHMVQAYCLIPLPHDCSQWNL